MKYLLQLMIAFSLSHSLAMTQDSSEKTKLAVNHLSACGNFVRADQTNVYSGFGPYWTGSLHSRTPRPGRLVWTPLDQRTDNLVEYRVTTLDSAIDFISYQGLGYVLTYSGIEEWDLTNQKRLSTYTTQAGDVRFGNEQHPKSFALYKDKLVIAHGRLGVSIFNLLTKKITATLPLIQTQAPLLESMAQGVTVSGRYAFVALDSYSLVGANDAPAFRGLVIIDMDTEKVIREINDLPPGLDSITSDANVVILSFYGNPLWKYTISNLLTAKNPQPTRRVFKFPEEGYPSGKALLDTKYYHSCFKKMPVPGTSSNLKKTKITMDRRQLMLD